MRHVVSSWVTWGWVGASALAACGAPEGNEAVEDELFGSTCTFTVKGKVQVEHQLAEPAELFGTSPLEGVKVKLSGRTWGTFASWGERTTSSTGFFSFTESKSCSDREFKVEVKFQSDELELRHEHSTSSLTKVKWYTISDTGIDHAPGTLDLGTLTFRAGGAHALGEDEPRAHADIWVVARMMIDELASYGDEYAFTDQLIIKYPNDSWLGGESEASYANPVTNIVYIYKDEDEDHFDTGTVYHESMHVWAYQHSTGEDELAAYLVLHGGTHGTVSNSMVAFHEGFAKFAAEELKELLFGKSPIRPFNRESITWGVADYDGDGAPEELWSLDDMDHHGDVGWYSAFKTLTQPDLDGYDWRTASTGAAAPDKYRIVPLATEPVGLRCDVPALAFRDVLTVFHADAAAGYPDVLDDREESLEPFFARAAAVVDGLDEDHADAMLELLDPSSTEQPRDLFCSSLLVKTPIGF